MDNVNRVALEVVLKAAKDQAKSVDSDSRSELEAAIMVLERNLKADDDKLNSFLTTLSLYV